ncbi:hypothetical protein [Enterobacter roggenkampii]|uniref:hypothetical protein n=1 Tax=Enterobacter roggenkampii TaxID=1812935 RepID=UPI000FCA1EB4|nr:hypothetical protein [Enterobacter roggenkampii]WFC89995.1 hypothetical protein OM420_15820 [Enterobacter roggenkampii]
MRNYIARVFILLMLTFSASVYACGDNPNAVIQGPFKDKSFTDGVICFQNTSDKRDIEFYLSFGKDNKEYNSKIDTFYYSDAPVELMSVFFYTS